MFDSDSAGECLPDLNLQDWDSILSNENGLLMFF